MQSFTQRLRANTQQQTLSQQQLETVTKLKQKLKQLSEQKQNEIGNTKSKQTMKCIYCSNC
jgi:hypothetical protein